MMKVGVTRLWYRLASDCPARVWIFTRSTISLSANSLSIPSTMGLASVQPIQNGDWISSSTGSPAPICDSSSAPCSGSTCLGRTPNHTSSRASARRHRYRISFNFAPSRRRMMAATDKMPSPNTSAELWLNHIMKLDFTMLCCSPESTAGAVLLKS